MGQIQYIYDHHCWWELNPHLLIIDALFELQQLYNYPNIQYVLIISYFYQMVLFLKRQTFHILFYLYFYCLMFHIFLCLYIHHLLILILCLNYQIIHQMLNLFFFIHQSILCWITA